MLDNPALGKVKAQWKATPARIPDVQEKAACLKASLLSRTELCSARVLACVSPPGWRSHGL